MLHTMQPFPPFANVESSRSYIDDLYSSDPAKWLPSIVCIKNSVIGSNRQKESVLAQGVLPRLLALLEHPAAAAAVRVEAAVTVGSLARGTRRHAAQLAAAGAAAALLRALDAPAPRLVDAALAALRALAPPAGALEAPRLARLLALAAPPAGAHRQACVAGVLAGACRAPAHQHALAAAGAHAALAALLAAESGAVRVPALACLAAMAWENRAVAACVAGAACGDVKLPRCLVGLIGRDRPVEMQLEAARCLTNLHRAGAIDGCDPIITHKTLPCLVRLCQLEHSEQHRAAAANTLAYLTEVDSNLQQIAAISNQLVSALVYLLNGRSGIARQAAFRAFASLGANDEDIRKRIIDTKCLMDSVLEGLDDENDEIRLAAVRCLHSLSRSVQQLRTTFQDHSVWRPLMALLTGSPSTELLTAASSALCNLLLEFSPAKEPMLQQGVVQLLATLTLRPEASLRLNGVWALMNLAFQAEQRVKSQILNALGTDQIFQLLADQDTRVLMKTLGLLRNLVSPRQHTDTMMALHGPQVMQGVVLVLEGSHAPEVKEQALCILGNIADGERAREHIMSNEDVLKKLIDYMTHPAPGLQEAAVVCINNLLTIGELGALERQARLKEMGVVNILQQLLSTSDSGIYNRVKAALTQFTDV